MLPPCRLGRFCTEIFRPDGSKLGAVDVMTELWSGKPPRNLCPRIEKLTLDGSAQVDPGDTVKATLEATDPEGEALKFTWVLARDFGVYHTAGDTQAATQTYPCAIVKAAGANVVLKMPRGGGRYRLFAYVRDGHGGAAARRRGGGERAAQGLGPRADPGGARREVAHDDHRRRRQDPELLSGGMDG